MRHDAFAARACLCAAILVAVSGWWYALKFIETGSFIGSHDVVVLRESGGMVAGLKQHWEGLVKAPWVMGMSFLWGGTWSFVLPPRGLLLGLVAVGAVVAYGACRHFRRHPPDAVGWFSLLVLALFIAALAQHSAVLISTTGFAAPAWYLHSLAPILALLLAAGLAGVMSFTRLRGVFVALLCYPLLFLPVALACNVLFFAGCGAPDPGRPYFDFAAAHGCATDMSRIFGNLAILGIPQYAAVVFAAGWALMVVGTIAALRSMNVLPERGSGSNKEDQRWQLSSRRGCADAAY